MLTYTIMQAKYRKSGHSIHSIHLHIYFVTKYRREFLTQSIADCVVDSVRHILEQKKCLLLESGAEPDHIHFLIDFHPDNNISQLVKSMKSVSSKNVQANFRAEFLEAYWDGSPLWGRQKAVISCGGAPLDTVMRYVKNQKGV